MFTKVVDDQVMFDTTRQMFNCAGDWVLWLLISVPVTLKLLEHGLLHVAGDEETLRKAGVVTHILSPEPRVKGKPEDRNQGLHEDFPSYLAHYFKCFFGLSVLVGCLEGSIVHVVPRTYGGESAEVREQLLQDGKLREIKLKRGSLLCMGPGLLHRGAGYDYRNSRLFVALLAGASWLASFLFTYNVESVETEEDGTQIPGATRKRKA